MTTTLLCYGGFRAARSARRLREVVSRLDGRGVQGEAGFHAVSGKTSVAAGRCEMADGDSYRWIIFWVFCQF